MRGADASAGTIKSGGAPGGRPRWSSWTSTTPTSRSSCRPSCARRRRSGPARRRLRHGPRRSDIASVQYQNANTRAGLRRVHACRGERRPVRSAARMTGEVIESIGARKLFHNISQPPGPAPTPACSTTTRSTTGTPARSPAGSPRPTVQRVPAPGQLQLQPRVAEPDEVPERRRDLRCRPVRQGR